MYLKHPRSGLFRRALATTTLVTATLAVTLLSPFAGGFGARPAQAAGFVVSTLADSGPGSLRQAILDANAAPGADTITFSVSGTIALVSTLPNITDTAGLLIDGTGQAVIVSGNYLVPPLTVSALAFAEVRKLTIQQSSGTAITNSGTLTLTNTTLSSNINIFPSGAAGIQNSSSGTMIVNGAAFTGNYAAGSGSAIYNEGRLIISDTTFNGNAAAVGGTVYNQSGNATITGSTFRGNFGGAGGAIFVHGGTAGVSNSTLDGNTAMSGGAIRNETATTVTNTTISNNIASIFGGGIWATGSLTLANTTLSGNSAGQGGGLDVDGAGTVATILNSTFVNRGGAGAGGISSKAGAVVNIANSVLANLSGVNIDCEGPVNATGPNVIQNPAGCTLSGVAPIVAPAKLAPLADNGGPTKTHALLTGSPAIDAGDPAICAAAPVGGKDQRGIVRPQGAACDIGAFELQPAQIGGKNLRISSTTAGVRLDWDPGTVQTAYYVLRLEPFAGTSLLSDSITATTLTDTGATAGDVHCYVVIPVNGGGVLGLSDLECVVRGIRSGSPPIEQFTLSLNQTSTATLTWVAPAGGVDSYSLAAILVDGSGTTAINLSSSATSATHDTHGLMTCYVLLGAQGANLMQTDGLCALSGVATLSVKPNSRTKAEDVQVELRQTLSQAFAGSDATTHLSQLVDAATAAQN